MQMYQQALEVDYFYTIAHFNLATEYRKLGYAEEAIVEYEKYLAYNPNAKDRESVLQKILRLQNTMEERGIRR